MNTLFVIHLQTAQLVHTARTVTEPVPVAKALIAVMSSWAACACLAGAVSGVIVTSTSVMPQRYKRNARQRTLSVSITREATAVAVSRAMLKMTMGHVKVRISYSEEL